MTSNSLRPSFSEFILRGLRARDLRSNAAYVLGRFPMVRRVYARSMNAAQRSGFLASALLAGPKTFFAGLEPAAAVAQIRATSVCTGLRLPQQQVARLVDIALTSTCRPRDGGSLRFKHADVIRGVLPNGEPAVIADVLDIEEHPLINEIARDPALLAIVERYMGYAPTRVDSWLHWSFVSNCTDEYRRAHGQTIDYHYDVHGYNFIYVSFYLTDSDARSGAHAFVENSHEDKPAKWLLDTARRSDAEIHAHYGLAREHVIEGRAGDGFVEDTSCYHKALSPLDRERLLLQFRYF